MARDFYYKEILGNTLSTSDKGLTEAQVLHRDLMKIFRASYNDSKAISDLDVIEKYLTNSDPDLGYVPTPLGKLRSPYKDGSKDTYFATSSFGLRWRGSVTATNFHHGIDLQHKSGGVRDGSRIRGTEVVAVADGEVYGVYDGKGITYIIIEHPKLGCLGTKGYTVYMHCSPIKVRAGQQVKEGQVIANESNVENYARHLHFEIRDSNTLPLDPAIYLDLSEANKIEMKNHQARIVTQAKAGGWYSSGMAKRAKELYLKKGTNSLNPQYS